MLHFIVLSRYFTFYKLKVCGNPVSSSYIGAIFPRAFAHFLSLCHVLVILQYFKLFHCCICYGDLWSVIFDVTIVIVLGHHEPHPYKMANLIYKYCFACSAYWLFPHLSPSPWATLFPETQKFEIRPINNPIIASKCSRERASCISPTLNQKLEMITLSEDIIWH